MNYNRVYRRLSTLKNWTEDRFLWFYHISNTYHDHGPRSEYAMHSRNDDRLDGANTNCGTCKCNPSCYMIPHCPVMLKVEDRQRGKRGIQTTASALPSFALLVALLFLYFLYSSWSIVLILINHMLIMHNMQILWNARGHWRERMRLKGKVCIIVYWLIGISNKTNTAGTSVFAYHCSVIFLCRWVGAKRRAFAGKKVWRVCRLPQDVSLSADVMKMYFLINRRILG